MTIKTWPRCSLFSLFPVILTILLVAPTDPVFGQGARHSASNVVPYLADDIMEITPPDKTRLAGFLVPSLQGRFRMGLQKDYANGVVMSTMGSQEILARRRGMAVKRSGNQLFMDLLTLGENKDIINPENLKQLYTNAKRPLKTNPYMRQWAPVLERAARGALSDAAYREVFCVKEAPCPLDKFNGARPYDIAGLMPVWGAAYNEFRFRAAYHTFLDKYAQALIDWGAMLDRKAIVVSTVSIPRYDFSEGAYQLRVNLGARLKVPPEGLANISTPDYDVIFHSRDSGGEIASLTVKWKLPRDKAEAFRNELTARKTNQLYSVVNGEFAFDKVDRAAMQNDNLLKQNIHVALTDDKIVLFYDAELSEEAVTFRIK